MIRSLRLFPLNAVLFPGATLNLHIFEPRYRVMLQECLDAGEGFGVALIADGAQIGDSQVTPHVIGAIAQISEVVPLPLGRFFVSTIGTQRFRIRAILRREPYLLVEAEVFDEENGDDSLLEPLLAHLRERFGEYLALILECSGEALEVDVAGNAEHFSFAVADALTVGMRIKQRLLELDDLQARLSAEVEFLDRLLPQLRRLAQRKREAGESTPDAEADQFRSDQERYFGHYFSRN